MHTKLAPASFAYACRRMCRVHRVHKWSSCSKPGGCCAIQSRPELLGCCYVPLWCTASQITATADTVVSHQQTNTASYLLPPIWQVYIRRTQEEHEVKLKTKGVHSCKISCVVCKVLVYAL
ncbi:unnamed protein product [Dicrocoelium dendriticum]|nr:unnamed protein product [Dicrocoelium dendriticum]